MDTFTVRDLRERTGELIRDAEAGELSVVTKHGRPVFIAIPFNETVIQSGIPVALAVKLFQNEVLSLGKAARLAACTVAQFSEYLAREGIPCVDYSPDDLEGELEVIG
ncbi:MAG: type II toxin-antitoxin system prevent-host-death family antitoxin [Thiohalomonadales bacterium]